MHAQTDTLFKGDRAPNYYYWEDEWIDYIYAHVTPQDSNRFETESLLPHWGCPEYARCFFTKDTLKIIGIAAAAELNIYYDSINPDDLQVKDSSILPEYFRVFYFTNSPDTATTWLAEVEYGTDKPRYMSYVGREWYRYYDPSWNYYFYRTRPGYKPIYEAYFDSAVYVIDTFYVSATANNNYIICDTVILRYGQWEIENYYGRYAHPHTRVYGTRHVMTEHFYDYPSFGNNLSRFNLIDEHNMWTYDYTVHTWREQSSQNIFAHIFPIFDTSTYTDTTTSTWCLAPDNLHVLTPDAESTVLLWHSASGSEWEVSHCIGCTVPDSGTITHHTATLANLTNLEEGATYTVWVRTLCDNGDTSLWSNSLQFYVPMPADTGVTQQVLSIDDAYFHLSPNPASKMVNAFSSFQMRGIDIYSLSGTLMKHEDVCALSVNIDISNLPKGLYIVRASTVHGMAYARLIIQ